MNNTMDIYLYFSFIEFEMKNGCHNNSKFEENNNYPNCKYLLLFFVKYFLFEIIINHSL